MPSCTVTVRAAGTPSATSICRIASEAQMKQSTWRYFQRDSALPRRWKSTRRAATSGGFGELRAHRQREAGHRDAVRIVRMDDVGLELLEQARQAPRRRQIHLRPRRERDEVEPFLRALPQLAVRMRDEHRAMAERAQAQHGRRGPGSGRRARSAPCRCAARTSAAIGAARRCVRMRAATRGSGAGSRGCRCSSHSFANFRKT